jgi:predicted 3-demethylubiquinone-9 3-methyltransferase (glyoxalase superfamily)
MEGYMQKKIIPNLWFDGNAQEAVEFYLSVFPNSRILGTSYYPTEGLADFQKDMASKVLTIDYELDGNRFAAINAGPEFKFNESVSFVVECKDQEEIDYYWSKLSHVPESEQCGWCKDQFGLSWQIVPEGMEEMMKKPEAFARLMEMHKIVIADF